MAAQEYDRSFNDDIYEHLCQKDDRPYRLLESMA